MSFNTSNLFDDSMFQDSQVQNTPLFQSLIPKKRYKTNENEATTSTPVKPKENVPPTTQNNEMIAILREILDNQKELSAKIQSLETNQELLFQKIGSLCEGQVTITFNQGLMSRQLENVENKSLDKSEMLAQSSLLRECKVSIKNTERSVSLMTGESKDSALDEVASLLPIQSLEAILEVEQRLTNPEFVQAMTTYVHKLKGTSDDIENIIKNIFTDGLLEAFNWDGRGDKQALNRLKIVETILRAVFQQQGSHEFERNIRRAIERSHHRMKQKKYIEKKKTNN